MKIYYFVGHDETEITAPPYFFSDISKAIEYLISGEVAPNSNLFSVTIVKEFITNVNS